MTREARVLKLVKHYQRLLGLDRWTIKVHFGEIADAKATCEAEPEYTKATIRFDLESFPEEEDHEYIIHELLHCHVWVLSGLASAFISAMPGPADKVAKEMLREAEERLTSLLEKMPVWDELE